MLEATGTAYASLMVDYQADPSQQYPQQNPPGYVPVPPEPYAQPNGQPQYAPAPQTGRYGFLPPMENADELREHPRYATAASVGPRPEPDVAGESVLDPLLKTLVQHGGSDLLLTVGTPPRLRIDGVLCVFRAEPLTQTEVQTFVDILLDPTRKEHLNEHRSVDFSFNWAGSSRFRGNIYFQRGHPSIALRHLPGQIPTPESLGVPPAAVELTQYEYGLVIVTGPTGSGKSTTIASMLDRINQTQPVHIITIEDPVEYEFSHSQAIIDQREVGWDTPSFKDALRSVLREDPDIVMVGEMRDIESIESTITVAETGHLVFATLHTNDAPQAIDRIIDVFPPEQQRQVRSQLSASLLAVIHQRLYPRPQGGRVAAFEVLLATDAVRNVIREGKTNQLKNMMSQGLAEGMQTLQQSTEALINNGVLDPSALR